VTTTRRTTLADAAQNAIGNAPKAATLTAPGLARARATEAPSNLTRPDDARTPGPFSGMHPLFFGLYPVLFLWSQNVGEVGLADAGDAIGMTFLALVLATAFLGLLFGDRRRGALLVTPAALGFLFYGRAAELDLSVQQLNGTWVVIMLVAFAAALRLASRWLARLDTALLRISVALVVISLVAIVPTEVEDALTPQPVVAAGRTLPTETSAQKRDVYWLVFDRYGSDRSFKLQFDVANELTPWLRERGFEVLADSHANYVATALSMATTLNMTPLDKLLQGVPLTSRSYQPAYDAVQSSLVVRQFQALGYRYVHLGSWWNATRTDEAADKNYNADGVSDFTSVLVETSVVPEAVKALDIEDLPPATESAKHLEHNTYALDALDALPREAGPKFVLAHVLLPHPPYIFDRDGRYIPPEEAATRDPDDLWERQLDYTNARLKAFLADLLSVPEDRRPIIIFQADEGPWPDGYAKDQFTFNWQKATPAELEIKFGIMNAWYVPGGTDLDLPPTMTAINTFPVLFDGYFGLDYPLLPNRVYTSRGWRQPYQLTDVTDRLPSLR
jgi:hypothetical protein